MSEPVPGSVIASAQTLSPLMIRGRYLRFCASVPKRVSHGEDMSVWTSTLKATPPERQRAISSPRTTLERKSPPPPPYSVGNSRPRKPSAPRRRQNVPGIWPASSHARTWGATSFSTKTRMLLRSMACSSEKMPAVMRLTPLHLRALQLTELCAPDLAGNRLRQIGDELDLARVFVGGGHGLDVLLQVDDEGGARRVAGRQDDERLDDLAAERIGLADDGRLLHRRVLDERRLYLERADTVGRAVDDVVGPAHDVINSASYRIGPFEVESALVEHPAVQEAAVIGKPDALRGEIVKAFVVLAPGHTPSAALVIDLQEHVKTVTAPYKYPREIEFVADLPKTISGKIRRTELRQLERARATKG